MVVVKNIESKHLELSYKGNNYSFPIGQEILVEEEIRDYLLELWPLAFDFSIGTDRKKPLPKAKVTKTKPIVPKGEPISDMEVTKVGDQKRTFTQDGEVNNAGFYGPGLEVDDLTE